MPTFTDPATGDLTKFGSSSISAGALTLAAVLGARAKRKAAELERKRQSFRDVAKIEQQKGAEQQAGLQNIISSLRSAFLG